MASKPTIKSGIIGSGFSARIHHDGIVRTYSANVDCLGVYSPTRANAERFASQRHLKVFTSVDALIDEADVVHICSPPATHEEIAIKALKAGTHAIVEKPFTGYFGDGSADFHIDRVPLETARDHAIGSIDRMLAAETESDARIHYAENWVFAPSIQKEREVIEKTGAQILWMHGEESHSGSHAETYGYWRHNGGGALIGKAVHPLSAALYLKRVEGRARNGKPIRPAAVTSRTHKLTQRSGFEDRGHLRTNYHDVEDFSMTHVIFEDGSIADIYAAEIVMGGIHNWLEVMANNHRSICNINPNTQMQTYNPVEKQFDDIYVLEKIGTKQGWAMTAPDEDHMTGFPQEINAFYQAIADGTASESDSALAADTISTVYSAYLSASRNGAEVSVKAY
ncbi:MAG: Gfo/Idh/MocA family oxidoreductase [Pseudomonadota bacterium]